MQKKTQETLKTLQREFKNPGSLFRGAPFWAWNGKLKPDELRRQIRLMKEMGLGGFFMHSRIGLDTPYLSDEWFDCIRTCCEEAEKLGMKAWLYDEDRWPSGAAGGLVTKNPGYRARSLVMEKLSDPRKLKRTKNTVAVFAAKVEGTSARDVRRIPGKKPVRLSPGETLLVFSVKINEGSSWFNGYTYLDTLNPDAVRQFIKVTYAAYRKEVGSRFGKSIPGIFTDEPYQNFSMFSEDWEKTGRAACAWTGKLLLVFKRRYGYDLTAHLPELFLDVDGQSFTPARYHYHECVTHLFVQSFGRQIGEWCGKNNLFLTGHILGEDTLSSQTDVVGSCMRLYEYMQAPGMDLLTEYWRIFTVAKQVSSAARQFGRKWRLTETYGCTGWDFPFSGHKALGDWQAALGINLRCQHLAWYTMLGEAKRDYPASISYQSPWWKFYSRVEDYFGRINTVMTRGEEARDLLVIHPVESMWVLLRSDWRKSPEVEKYDRTFWRLSDALLAGHLDFDYGDEDILFRHGRIGKKDGSAVFVIGRASYRSILVPPMLTMRRTTLALIKRFQKAGGHITFAGEPPEYVDATPSTEVKDFAAQCRKAPAAGTELVKTLEDNCRRISITDREGGQELGPVLYLLREDKNALYLFVCNTGQDFAGSERHIQKELSVRERNLFFPKVIIRGVPDWQYAPLELNPETGEIVAADTRQTPYGYIIHTDLPKLGSRLFLIPKKSLSVEAGPRIHLKENSHSVLDGPDWEIRLSEPNVLPLDRPQLKIADDKRQPENEVLRADKVVRDYLGIPHRTGDMVQPWAQQKNPRPKSVPISLLYTFESAATPGGKISLALEKPHLFRISLNGTPVSVDAECGWWVDRSLRTVPIDSALLRSGQNEILLECAYDENHPGLEIIYLLGDFGAEVTGTRVSLTAPVHSLKLGDWTEQGLPFYSGSVSYLRKIQPVVPEGGRLFVRIPNYRGVAVRILVDGKEAGVRAWEPYEIDVTDFVSGQKESTLAIEIIGHRRNSHGPLHLAKKWPIWTGSPQYATEGKEWQEEYQSVSCGLMAAPELIVRRPI
ncbi:MAG: glycosyl hydrolase [Candidatus Omnitrophota bacterium]